MSNFAQTSGLDDGVRSHSRSSSFTKSSRNTCGITLAGLDICFVCLSFLLAGFLAEELPRQMPDAGERLRAVGPESAGMWPMAAAVALILVALLAAMRSYSIGALISGERQATTFAIAWSVAFGVTLSAASRAGLARAGLVDVALVAFGIGLFGVLPLRRGLFALVRHGIAAMQSGLCRAVLIQPKASAGPAKALKHLAGKGIAVAANYELDLEVLCPDDAIQRAIGSQEYEAVCVMLPSGEGRNTDQLRASLSTLPVPVFIITEAAAGWSPGGRAGDTDPPSGFNIHCPRFDAVSRLQKRVLDIVVAGCALVLLSPLLAAISISIVIDSGRPVFFRQTRRGFGTRGFEIYKFRTMTVCENGPAIRQALRDDPRVTRIGKFLRASSLDELPQLLNILKGEMSIVGPRPHAVAHDTYYMQYISSYALRHLVRPGLTGWAQINGLRGETADIGTMRARIEHDIHYIANWSLWLDLRIIVRTALTLINDKNAY